MEKTMDILTVVLPVAVALLLGFFSRRKNLVAPAAIDGIKTLVMNFTLPAVLLNAFYTAQLSAGYFIVAGIMALACLLALGTGALLHKFVPRSSSLFPFLTTGFEAGMMGYGLYTMLWGPQNVWYLAMVDLGQVVFVFTLYMALLNRRQGYSPRATLKGMFTSPVFLAVALGLGLAATGLGQMLHQGPAGPVAASLLTYIAAPTGMLMLFVVGYGLTWKRADAKAALATLAARVVIMGALCALCLLVLRLFMPLPPPLVGAVVLMFSLPPPFVLPIFSKDETQTSYISSTLSLSAIFSLCVFAIMSAII